MIPPPVGFAFPIRTVAVAAALAVVTSPVAHAKHWAQPAAGDSASGQPEIIFTFDDGPHHKYTNRILDELDAHGIQALFFWVGHRVLRRRGSRGKRRAVVARAIAEGHVVGTHTVNHVHLCRMKPGLAAIEIDEAIAEFERLTAMDIWLFRAPYGDRCRSLIEALDDRGMSHMHWDLDPREWLDHDPERTAAYLIRKIGSLKGRGVVLLHDTKLASVKALPIVLKWIKRENARRRARGKLEIKIVSPSDLIAERMDHELWDWARSIASLSAERAAATASRLIPGDRGTTTARLPLGR